MAGPPIALDAFGGDDCPRAEVEAAALAAAGGLQVVLVGDAATLEGELRKHGGGRGGAIEIAHASDVIAMDDAPGLAVRGKTDASMPVGFDLVKRGDAAAVVSAGNSGAMLACGLFKMGRIKGVDRPAILIDLPTDKDAVSMLDVGANVECRPVNLVQFAAMGAVYARIRRGREHPKVALLSNGAEESKGTELTRAAHQMLVDNPIEELDYVGYAEGKDVFAGDIDVVVTDGFTGNIALKMAEGAGVFVGRVVRRAIEDRAVSKLGALLMKPSLDEVKRTTDLERYGGAPLLGVNGIAVICHGNSGPRGIAKAIEQAAIYLEQDLVQAVTLAIEHGRRATDDARAEPA